MLGKRLVEFGRFTVDKLLEFCFLEVPTDHPALDSISAFFLLEIFYFAGAFVVEK